MESHASLEELAAYSDVPVINALSDRAHPCQTLADLLTVREVVGDLAGASATWVGDGNNVAQSFALGCAITGVDLTVATPEGYELDDDVRERAAELGEAPTETHDPEAAVTGADVVYTGVWASMSGGQKDLDAFEDFQVDDDLLAGTDATFMHSLAAHRGEEATDAVVESERSAVFQQAENRMHVQTALLAWLVKA